MPIYDFKCPKCGTELKDQLIKYSEVNDQICPREACQTKMERQHTVGQLRFLFNYMASE